MTTVREASFELFREHGMTTIFGNPGSTELPMLAEFPDDFRYVLGLQEAVVVGMADGYAQASGMVTHVNLHTAPGVGNGMGAIFNAQANKAPLLVTAGQQVRAQMTMNANLTNRDATRVVASVREVELRAAARRGRPAGARARDPRRVDRAARARRSSRCRWTTGTSRSTMPRSGTRSGARSARGAGADPDAVKALAKRIAEAENPVLVAGPDIDAAGGWDDAVALAERQKLPGVRLARTRRGADRLPRGPSRSSRACCRRRSARSPRRSRART